MAFEMWGGSSLGRAWGRDSRSKGQGKQRVQRGPVWWVHSADQRGKWFTRKGGLYPSAPYYKISRSWGCYT